MKSNLILFVETMKTLRSYLSDACISKNVNRLQDLHFVSLVLLDTYFDELAHKLYLSEVDNDLQSEICPIPNKESYPGN